MTEARICLTPVQEIEPGQISSIRDAVIAASLAKASAELGLPQSSLVVRPIRAYDDLNFGVNTDYLATAQGTNVWGTFKSSDSYIAEAATAGAFVDAIPDDTTMEDNRYVVIYGVRDMRASLATIITQDISLIKFDIGNADRVIWDISKVEGCKNAMAGITSSAIVIPPLAPYQISLYLEDGGVAPYLQLMGFVIEPVGLTIVPEVNPYGAALTQLVPIAEMAVGAISAIRNKLIAQVVEMASKSLNKNVDELIVRDIRPFSDLAWATHANIGTAALTEDEWIFESDDSANYNAFTEMIAASSANMADNRYVCIYGVKDMRMSLNSPIAQALSMLKFNVGGDDKAIWDLQDMQAYRSRLSSVCLGDGIIIPPNTSYQIYGQGCLSDDGGSTDISSYIVLEGFVVEPKGKVLSP